MTRREFGLALAGGLLLAVVMFWPLVLHMQRDIPDNLGDPLLQAWQGAWGAHALFAQPQDFWQGNIFWPSENSLAFSDALAGYIPVGVLFGDGVDAALLRYNVFYLLAYALAFAGPYALARELGLGPVAAIVAGVAFAYSPWRMEHSGHLHIVSSGPIALSIAALLHGYRHARPRWIVAGWAIAAWQVAIGLSLGLMLAYTLAALGAFVLVRWWRAGRPPPPRAVLVATGAGLALFAVVCALMVPPYASVRDEYPEAKRTLYELEVFSPPPRSFLVTPVENPIWGGLTADRRASLPAVSEQTLFPGLLTLLLAGAGLATGVLTRRLRIGLAVTITLTFLFSMGTALLGGRLTYRLLYDYAPGWDGTRTPGRLHTLTTLVLALLAAAGATWLLERLRARRAAGGAGTATGCRGRSVGWVGKDRDTPDSGAGAARRAGHWLPAGAAALLVAALCFEGSAFRFNQPGQGLIAGAPHPTVPKPPPGLGALPGPQLHLPPREPAVYVYMLWSVDRFPPIVNGLSGFYPVSLARIEQAAIGFPDAPSVQRLRAIGVRTVVLHPAFAPGTAWADAQARPVAAGLGVRRKARDGIVIYDLGRP